MCVPSHPRSLSLSLSTTSRSVDLEGKEAKCQKLTQFDEMGEALMFFFVFFFLLPLFLLTLVLKKKHHGTGTDRTGLPLSQSDSFGITEDSEAFIEIQSLPGKTMPLKQLLIKSEK